jgi:hypothetical protein
MPGDINIDELLQLLKLQQNEQNSQETLEQMLLSLILNPIEVQRQRIRIDDLGEGVVFELREGSIINENGYQEKIQELVINSKTFADGSPMNIYGVARCQNCGSLVLEDSIRVCQFCGRICCISRGCARVSRISGKSYCCRTHRFLGLFGLSIR